MADLLTEREMQVLHLLSHGLKNPEIGRKLSTTEDTIKSHNQRIFKKLGAKGRAHAVRRGFELALLQSYSDPNELRFDARPTPTPPGGDHRG